MDNVIGRTLPLKFGSSFENGDMGTGVTRTMTSGFSGTQNHRIPRGRSGVNSSGVVDHCDKYHTVRYDFKPASLDQDRPGEVEIQGDREVTITLPTMMPTTATGGPGPGPDEDMHIPDDIVYKGNKKPAQKECLLIIDHETGEVTLEKLDSAIIVKKTRKEKSLKQQRPNLYASSYSEVSAFSQNSKAKQPSEANNISGPSPDFLINQDSNASEKSHSSDSSKHSISKVAKKSKKEKEDFAATVNRSPPKVKSSTTDSQPMASKFVTPSPMTDVISSQPKGASSWTNRIQEVPDNRRIKDDLNNSKQPKKKENERELSRVRNLSSSDSGSSSSDSDSSSGSSDDEEESSTGKDPNSCEGQPANKKLPNTQISSKVASSFDLRDDLQLSDSD